MTVDGVADLGYWYAAHLRNGTPIGPEWRCGLKVPLEKPSPSPTPDRNGIEHDIPKEVREGNRPTPTDTHGDSKTGEHPNVDKAE